MTIAWKSNQGWIAEWGVWDTAAMGTRKRYMIPMLLYNTDIDLMISLAGC